MEEKDIFGLDDRDLRLPRQYSRPRQVASSMLIDDSARYLGDAVTKGVTSFDKRMASIQASKDALTTFVTGLQEQATSLDNLDDNNVSDQIQKLLNEQIDEINLLGYNSIGRDQTEFIKRKSQLVSSTKNLLENMLNKDEQAAEYQKAINSGQGVNKISQLTPSINQEYLQDILLRNGRGSKVEYKDGAFIVTFTGKDGKTLTYNASNDINATKKGAKPLIQYVDDFDPSYKTSYDRIAAKYQPTLTSITKFVGEGKNRRKIITKAKEYNTIRESILEELKNDPNFAANVSLDETQYLRGKGVDGIEEVYDITLGDEKSLLELNDKIKEQRANYILNQYLPADAIISKEDIQSPVQKNNKGDSNSQDSSISYKKWISKNITGPKIKQTRYHGSPKEVTGMFDIPIAEKRKRVLEKIRSFNKTDLVYGNHSKVINALGKTKADSNKLYELIIVPGAGAPNAFEVTVSNEDILNSESLNKLLIDYSIKFNKSSVL